MRPGLRFGLAAVVVVAFAGLGAYRAAEKEDPKYTIKEVMKVAHGKNGLLKKVVGGNAEDREKKDLLEMYDAMGKNKPPKGDEKEWKDRCDSIAAACKELIDNKEGAGKKLQKAANCMACHTAHRVK